MLSYRSVIQTYISHWEEEKVEKDRWIPNGQFTSAGTAEFLSVTQKQPALESLGMVNKLQIPELCLPNQSLWE